MLLHSRVVLYPRHSRVHTLGFRLEVQSTALPISLKVGKRPVMQLLLIICCDMRRSRPIDHLICLRLLKLGNELLYELITLLNQFLVGNVKLIFVEKIRSLIPTLREIVDSRLHLVHLGALASDNFSQIQNILRRALVLELLNKIFKLADTLNQPLSIEYGALEGIIRHSILFCKLEKLELLTHLF